MRVLSIDWDYFVDEDPGLDFGHREAPVFLGPIWEVRRHTAVRLPHGEIALTKIDITKILPFVGSEDSILDLSCLPRGYRLFIAESHRAILSAVGDLRNLDIINIDAHHDIYYETSEDGDCGSWGRSLVNGNRLRSFTQIYPAWRKKYPEDIYDISAYMHWAKVPYSVHTGEDIASVVKWQSVDAVFVCRSGCWTPPEYDIRFNSFCKRLGADGLTARK
jgi:hypothetical protein